MPLAGGAAIKVIAWCGEEGRGFYLMMGGIENERLSIGAQCVGMAERAIEITLGHPKQRQTYRGTLWDLQAIRHDMARQVSDLSAAKLLLYHAAARKSGARAPGWRRPWSRTPCRNF